ncbi:MAG: hypothetical protein CVU68_00505 [Deltaproteobacteria bacterium HGW-Deltaproteobacteria-3]|jgi:hypothetical protein|nr:MAG: hypothetical protein CVU68_00505 [Deltaproteobacteria bacterium HGW-Deltaproteobacteria-3]
MIVVRVLMPVRIGRDGVIRREEEGQDFSSGGGKRGRRGIRTFDALPSGRMRIPRQGNGRTSTCPHAFRSGVFLLLCLKFKQGGYPFLI